MVRGHGVLTDTLRQLVADLFNQTPRVNENKRGSVPLRQCCELVIEFGPHGRGSNRTQLVGGHFNCEVQRAPLSYLHDHRRLAVGMATGEKAGDKFNGILRRREANALRSAMPAGRHRTRAQPVFPADQGFQSLQTQRKVGAAFVVGYCVDLIDDQRAHAPQMLPRLARREQEIQRLRRGDEDVRGMLQHRHALFGGRVAGTDAGADLRTEIAACQR